MRTLIAALLTVAVAVPAGAADLFLPIVPPKPAVVIERVDGLCSMRPGNLVRQMPEGRIERTLPTGFFVIVIDWPFSKHTDLWVRITGVDNETYYGWVRPTDLHCY